MMFVQFVVAMTLVVEVLAMGISDHVHPHPLHRRMMAHYPEDVNWLDAVQKEHFTKDGVLNRKAREHQPDITCVPYASGREAKQNLQQHYQHVETIHADKPTDRTCFLLVKEPVKGATEDIIDPNVQDQQLARLAHQLGATSWHTLDNVLKLEPSALLHASDVAGFEAVAKAHHHKRLLQSTSQPRTSRDNYWFTANPEMPQVKQETHEYEIQVTLMPGKASASVQESVSSILDHLHGPVDEREERALLDTLGEKYKENSGLWKAGHECLDIMKAQAHARARTRHLQGSVRISSTGVNYREIADVGPLGFRLASVGLHGGRQLDATPVLSRACHVYVYAKLVQHPAVLNVAVAGKMRIMNDVSKSLFQSNTQQTGGANRATAWPYQTAGLDGTGQVIIVSDTGLDTDHCQFRENTGVSKIPPMKMVSSQPPFPFDLTKRKVVQYMYWYASDMDDYDGGHGTHMASSSCGANIDASNSAFNGMAPNAKLAFWDIGDAQGGLSMPSDMSMMFLPGKAAGAHIFSGSWGSTENIHSQSTTVLDRYSYSSDDEFLGIFACGNEGQEGYFSVGDPAFAKNALTVGAHESNWNFAKFGMLDTAKWRTADQTNMAYFSSMGPTYDFRIKPDIASPGMYINAAMAAGDESCGFTSEAGTSSATALTSGIAALVRQYYMDSDFHQTVTSPSVLAFTPSGALVKATIIHAGQQMYRYFPKPTKPGFTSTSYRTEVEMGTVLGGPFDTGSTEESDVDLPQVGDSYKPDFIGGFGRINLKNSLPVPGASNWPFDLHAYDAVSITSDTEYSWFVRTPASGTWLASPGAQADEAILKATLVWMDPPVYPFVDKNMVHDLDLVITEVTSPTANYPEPSATDPIWFGNGEAFPDSTNNVEQISITTLANKGRTGLKLNSYYRVTVRANVLTEADNQKFSLVITTPKTDAHASTVTVPDYSNPAPVVRNEGLGAIENICASNELEIEITLSSHLAIGWQGGDRYTITNVAGTSSFSRIGTMNATRTESQMMKKDVVCLPVGTYFIKLEEVTDTASTVKRDRYLSLGQTALDINDCYVHLQGQYSRRNATMTISSEEGVLKCNYCNASNTVGIKHYPVEVLLYGSVYGGRLSYGWENKTSYSLWQNGHRVGWNTLNQGIIGNHRYCLAEGPYSFGFETFSDDDDFDTRPTVSNDFVSGYYGITEYSMSIYGCANTGVLLKKIDAFVKTNIGGTLYWVTNTAGTASLTNTEDIDYCTSMAGPAPVAEAESSSLSIYVLIVIILVAGFLGLVGASYAYTAYCVEAEGSGSHNERAIGVMSTGVPGAEAESRVANQRIRNEFELVTTREEFRGKK